MATWSTEPFGNDSAVDWSYGLEQVNDLSLIDDALSRVLDCGDDYLESPEAEEAIAAIDVIARLNGNFYAQDSHTESADTWVAAHALIPTPVLIDKAIRVLDRIVTEPSEVYELWQEGEDFDEWRQQIDSLRARIQREAL